MIMVLFRMIYIILGLALSLSAQYNVQKPFPKLSVTQPNTVTFTPSQPNWIFIVGQQGVITRLDRTLAAETEAIEFLDISSKVVFGGEQGLLGLAFHPEFASNGLFYVDYTADNPRRTVIERYQADPSSLQANPGSGQVILEVEQPFSNHNAGDILFGADGYLYVTLGDGGSGGDPQGHGQNRQTLLGSILRIDVDNPAPGKNYGIPADNPFVGNDQGWREEIWAYGLRNPWRMAFDQETGELWTADVGQNAWEEIDIITKGGNYGWNIMEGTHCYPPGNQCNTQGFIYPVWEYSHENGNRSITGGRVYRGTRIPELVGAYIYADFVSGRIWALFMQNGSAQSNELLLDSELAIASFGTDADKNLYISAFDGSLYQLVSPTLVENDPYMPSEFRLLQNYPNPFNDRTAIRFDLEKESNVTLDIYNLHGQHIKTLTDGFMAAKSHQITWNGTDKTGRSVASGVYIYRLLTGNDVQDQRKMLFLK
jgi:glucose/arabinose dehydrogenase